MNIRVGLSDLAIHFKVSQPRPYGRGYFMTALRASRQHQLALQPLYEFFINLLLNPYEFSSKLNLSPSARAIRTMSSQRSMLDSSPDENRPIQLITENGFSIRRSWEVEHLAPPTNGKYCFLVSAPADSEREIIVEVTGRVVLQITVRTRGRIRLQGTFWIYAAERHLANYLWEKNFYPPGDKLRVEELDSEDCILALRWETT
jgi:hypothetical protein